MRTWIDGGSSLKAIPLVNLRTGSNFLKGSRPELFSVVAGLAATLGSCADTVAVNPANSTTQTSTVETTLRIFSLSSILFLPIQSREFGDIISARRPG